MAAPDHLRSVVALLDAFAASLPDDRGSMLATLGDVLEGHPAH
jgi:hypothetical protein